MNQTSDKLKILAIHGYAQSQDIFKGKLGSLRKGFKKKVEFTFISAPHEVSMKNNFGDEIPESSDTVYGWWFSTNDGVFKVVESEVLVGFEESLALVQKTFKESGPFDGILGFSQGASFLSVLCNLQQQKCNSIIFVTGTNVNYHCGNKVLDFNFRFAILISGFKSLCSPHTKYYNEKLDIPSLHVYGTTDRVIPTEMAAELSDLFKNKKVIVHEGGHYIPSSKKFYEDFIEEMLSKKGVSVV